jgi:DNA primase
LFQARQAIREAGRVVVVEGYMDVVALAQFGVGYAVATLGTATTPWHVQKLLRQADEVVFCFDADNAGRRAAWRALENSLEHLQDGKQVKFLFLPEGHDPDSFIRAHGREAFESALEQALPLSAFALKELTERVDLGTAEGRAKFLQDAKPLVKRISAPMLSLVLRKRVAELAGVTQAELEQRFDIGAPRRPSQPAPVRGVRLGADPYGKLLERVLAEPRLLRELDSADLPRPRQPGAEAAALLDLIEQSHAVPGELSVAGAIELLRARGHDAVLQRLLPVAHDLQGLSPEELAVEVRAYVASLQAGAQRDEMTRTVAGVSSPGELSENDRALVVRALAPAKLVERDH